MSSKSVLPAKGTTKARGKKRKADVTEDDMPGSVSAVTRPRKKAKSAKQKKEEKQRAEQAHAAGEGLAYEKANAEAEVAVAPQPVSPSTANAPLSPATIAEKKRLAAKAEEERLEEEAVRNGLRPVTTGTPIPKPIGYEPISDKPVAEGQKDFGKYAGHLVFESDVCKEKWKGFDIRSREELDYDVPTLQDQKKTTVTGEASTKKYKIKDNGRQHLSLSMVEGELRRKSAAENLKIWREHASGDKQREDRRKARHVTLNMGAPTGPSSESALWADQVKGLENLLSKKLAGIVGSFFVINVDMPDHEFVVQGLFRPYVEALRQLMAKFSENVRITLADEAVLEVEPSSYYP
jgi:hypothetical protein